MADGLPKINTDIPHSARIWNYWLGGKDFYPVDRKAGDAYLALAPQVADIARSGRRFLARGIRFLAGEAGVRQFLDIGTGLPTVDNTHEIAQRVAPDARIVYVDNDPLVLAHARALLNGTPQGKTIDLDQDLREPEKIIEAAAGTLDFSQPIALLLMGVLGHIVDDDEAQSVVKRLKEALPSGSYLMLYDGHDGDKTLNEAQRRYDSSGAVPYILRCPSLIEQYFEGLDPVEPGIVAVERWRPETDPPAGKPDLPTLCAVARKP